MTREQRKLDHIRHALTTADTSGNGFRDMQFIHQCFPEINVEQTNVETMIGPIKSAAPIMINAMTGGGGQRTKEINGAIAELAANLGVPAACGSQMAAVKDSSQQDTFSVMRERSPYGILFANIGAEAAVDEAAAAVNMIQANALQIHINPIQELVMPEGDRHFNGLLEKIAAVKKELEIPLIVKEVGFGMSMESAKLAVEAGADIIDTGGHGGTNFSAVENSRRQNELSMFDSWGIPTAVSLIETKQSVDVPVIASGGIRTADDILKSLSCGAAACGMAGAVLKNLQEKGLEKTAQEMNDMIEYIRLGMTALGKKRVKDLTGSPVIISGSTGLWLKERGISTSVFARRTSAL
ncbi:type 2 isopentenyl-diphosphate Delta-isomerase [Alkalicoccus luteus]|uniref:Isopentenyl-diphosphate delta-isomerase n=1 Tax=Alkalicoccus luteus TaxID=1237094 RepID=A0A969PRR5_9BACI|nr:type 2 isopentenyl-diphosphate Delta-isomerase [Alkalicoccus luteus]NJP38173.1 type 2 isopentenyl-diphosphate Delta-isomerase [Alkalicoccus luteus]